MIIIIIKIIMKNKIFVMNVNDRILKYKAVTFDVILNAEGLHARQ